MQAPAAVGRRSPLVRLLFAASLTLLLAGCSATGPATPLGPSPAGSSAPDAAAMTARLPTGQCGDDQPGRYVAELFEPAPVVTTTFSNDLQVDIYAPADDPAACKVGIVWVHGGGFTQAARDGDAEQSWGAALAARGYVLASIDYRLGSGEPFGLDQAVSAEQRATVAAAIADAQSAVRWLRDSGDEFGVDPERVAIGGTSAGAMTSLGAALTAADRDRVCTAVSVSGDLDPGWIGAEPPPVLFIHGNADTVVPYNSSVTGRDLLTAAGAASDLVTIDGAGHEIVGVPTTTMVLAAAGWLREHAAARCG